MSNQNINISATNIAGKCDLKCSYNFKYSESNSTAKNNGEMISLTYDSTSVPPVIYNNEKYTVGSISIVSPSIHIFNGSTKPGEIIITHNPVKGGNTLDVCIPFTSSSESSKASQIITEIIGMVSTNAPSEGESTNLNISGFNLQNIIPKKPFFSYTQDTTDYIVFGDLQAIPLSSSTISTLQQIIKPFSINTPGGQLFYNSKGPTSGVPIGEGIYISCQPTGSSQEETPVEYEKNPSTTINLSNILDNKTFKIIISIIIGCLLFIIIFYGISKFYSYLSSEPIKMSFPKLS
jgi:carbonic anhydrase